MIAEDAMREGLGGSRPLSKETKTSKRGRQEDLI